ncbi:putative isomerase YbhE [Ramaria rubella]|nr:putative isomerase YbhE [Ramaria rubella]
MSRKILVASYSSQITTLSFDSQASPPSLSVVSSVDAGYHPSWITSHKTDASVIFTANEQPEGKVKALKYDLTSGEGKIIAEVSSGGADPCHLAISGNDLIIANYSGGNVGVFPLLPSAPYLPPQPSQVLPFIGSGPILSRQEASHPHQVLVHPTRNEVIIPDLGADKLWRLEHDGSKWLVGGFLDMQRGGGPRHGVVLGETLFTLLELSNTITSHKLPALPHHPVLVSTAATLSDPPLDPTAIQPPPLSAEILCPPVSTAYSTQYLYVTNRNDPSSEGDILSVFEVGEDGAFELINEIRTGLRHLRGIAFDEQSRYLIAGGAFGGGVKIFERVDGGRNLKEIAWLKDVKNPTGFHWLPIA